MFVTYRLGAMRMTNRILVMDAGKFVGDGCHSHLLDIYKEYEELWSSQAQAYNE